MYTLLGKLIYPFKAFLYLVFAGPLFIILAIKMWVRMVDCYLLNLSNPKK